MGAFFNTILYQPLFNGLVVLYKYVAFEDLGLAIILLTIVIRLILYPLFSHSFKNQTIMQRLQPHVQKIQHDHKHDKEKQAQALMQLYKEHKVNPFSGFLLILVQLPILIVLYNLFLKGLTPESFGNLYSFITAPSELHHSFLGLLDLSSKSIVIVVLAALLQFLQSRLSLPKTNDDSPTAKIGRSMIYVGPVMTILILASLPSAIGIYWMTTSAFSIIQQLIINKKLKDKNYDRAIQGTSQKVS